MTRFCCTQWYNFIIHWNVCAIKTYAFYMLWMVTFYNIKPMVLTSPCLYISIPQDSHELCRTCHQRDDVYLHDGSLERPKTSGRDDQRHRHVKFLNNDAAWTNLFIDWSNHELGCIISPKLTNEMSKCNKFYGIPCLTEKDARYTHYFPSSCCNFKWWKLSKTQQLWRTRQSLILYFIDSALIYYI